MACTVGRLYYCPSSLGRSLFSVKGSPLVVASFVPFRSEEQQEQVGLPHSSFALAPSCHGHSRVRPIGAAHCLLLLWLFVLVGVQALAGSSSSSLVSRGSSLPDLSAALKPSRHGSSYAHLLADSRQQQYEAGEQQQAAGEGDDWQQQLDDPNIQSGRHRVVLPLPGLMSSVISFVRGKELKQQLNAQFRQKVSQQPHCSQPAVGTSIGASC